MDIQFCDNCENLMFIYLDEQNDLIYKCKNCNFQKAGDATTKCVYRNDLQNKEKIQEMNVKMNDFIKYDPHFLVLKMITFLALTNLATIKIFYIF